VKRTTVLMTSTGEAELLRRSLPAALAQDGADVVVVDNGCLDDTSEVAEQHGARLLRFPEKTQYCAITNAAIEATGGDAVLLLNADCFLDPGFLAAARPRLDEEGVGSVTPKLLRTEGPAGPELDAVDCVGMVVDRRRKNLLVGHGAPAAAYAMAGPVFGGDGAAVLWRRAALEDCAFGAEVLDEDLELWTTEFDLAWRAQLRGWRFVYEPSAVARHVRTYSPSTPRERLAAGHRRMQFRNRLLMAYKNETPLGLLVDLPWIAGYEIAALGFALLRERELLGAYADAWALRAAARRRRRVVQSRRRVRRPPFGLAPPA